MVKAVPRTLGWLFGVAVTVAPALTSAGSEPVAPGGHICGAAAPATGGQAAQHILAGYGTGGFPVRTAVPAAQAYFDNGMQLAHAFAHKPAIAAFREAERLDPTCAMCAWGEAWARGPTINYNIAPKEQTELAGIADRAAALARRGPPREQRLAAALQKRYRNGGGKGLGDEAFARAMDQIARDNPADNEIAILAADAWMIPAALRESRNNLPRALELIGGALRRNPGDTGAIHFYIHATEMNGVGGEAEAYADTLQRLAPAASHLVHMPSHTYYIVGRYEDAVQANLAAIKLDGENAAQQVPGGDPWKLTYHPHNVQFAIGAALMSGDAAAALAQSQAVLVQTAVRPPPPGWPELGVATAYFAQGRYADPARVLALPDPGPAAPVLRALWRYSRGEAQTRLGDAAAVRREALRIVVAPADLKAFDDYAPNVGQMIIAAQLVLQGRADMLEGKPREAAAAFRQAAAIQDAKLGRMSDPPAWWYPIRRSYAAALLADGRPEEAAEQARNVLKTWPNDPVTLDLLARAELKLGDGKAAELHLAQARRGWRGGARLAAATARFAG